MSIVAIMISTDIVTIIAITLIVSITVVCHIHSFSAVAPQLLRGYAADRSVYVFVAAPGAAELRIWQQLLCSKLGPRNTIGLVGSCTDP